MSAIITLSGPYRLLSQQTTTPIELRQSAFVRYLHSRTEEEDCLREGVAVVFGMPGQLQQLTSPQPPGAKEDLSDSEKEEEEVEGKEEQAGCYTNGSFFIESRNKLTRWLSQTDMVEEVEKV